ncbi:DUF4328 domain-containing protein [Streptomyces sp. NPDC086787]|uniref:DUF4328 domain-containing protein n=1 Tax=Streptomyces sp. NPDC086787 TaxID=3365759 RepID=UPI003802C6A9
MLIQSSAVVPPSGLVVRSVRPLAIATSALLGLTAAADLFAVYAGIQMHRVSGALFTRSDDEIVRTDDLYQLAGRLQLSGILVTAIVFLLWFYRVRCNADVFVQDVCTRSRGWAIGSWFIPIANLWMPFTIAREIWTASAQTAPDKSWREVSQRLVKAWWTSWIAAVVMARISSTLQSRAKTPEALQHAADMTMAADALNLAAALLAIAFVWKLTAMQHPNTTLGTASAT